MKRECCFTCKNPCDPTKVLGREIYDRDFPKKSRCSEYVRDNTPKKKKHNPTAHKFSMYAGW